MNTSVATGSLITFCMLYNSVAKRPKSLPSLDEVVGIGNSSRHSLVSTSPATVSQTLPPSFTKAVAFLSQSDGSECHDLSNCVEISIRDGQETLDVDVAKGAIGHQVIL